MGVTSSGITEEAKNVIVKTAKLSEEVKGEDTVLRISKITAYPGETICWDVGDREVSIWFPKAGLFATQVLAMKHKGTIEATIAPNAERGIIYEYAIYDHGSDTFVVCESHPKVEVPIP